MSVVRKVETMRLLQQLSLQHQTEFLETFWRNLTLTEKMIIYACYVADAPRPAWWVEQDLLTNTLRQEE